MKYTLRVASSKATETRRGIKDAVRKIPPKRKRLERCTEAGAELTAPAMDFLIGCYTPTKRTRALNCYRKYNTMARNVHYFREKTKRLTGIISAIPESHI